jgi:sugar fermentation stimulation protein A
VVIFTVQRGDCEHFEPADDIDPEYGRALRQALDAGVEAFAYGAKLSNKGVWLTRPLPIRMP